MEASGDADLEITPSRAQELVRSGRAQIVDVREQYEWDAGRIPGARHIPLTQLGAQAKTLDPDVPVIFQCRVGGRSAMAAQAYRASGRQAWSLAGGLLAWADEDLPLDGVVAEH